MPSLPPSILDRRPVTCGSACLMVALPPAGDIGGQDGGKSAFDAALPRSGHGAPLWGGILHRTTAGWMARWADARSGRPGLRGYSGLTLWGHGRSACDAVDGSSTGT